MHHWRWDEVYWATRHPGIFSSQEELFHDCNDIDRRFFVLFLLFYIQSLGTGWALRRCAAMCGAMP